MRTCYTVSLWFNRATNSFNELLASFLMNPWKFAISFIYRNLQNFLYSKVLLLFKYIAVYNSIHLSWNFTIGIVGNNSIYPIILSLVITVLQFSCGISVYNLMLVCLSTFIKGLQLNFTSIENLQLRIIDNN